MMDLSSISRYYSVLILAKTHEILKLELNKGNCTLQSKGHGVQTLPKLQECDSISIGYLHHLIATLYSTEVVTNQSQCIIKYISYNQLAIPAKPPQGCKTASGTGHTQPLFYIVVRSALHAAFTLLATVYTAPL